MPGMAAYLKDIKEELRRVGDVVFKQRHRTPVLIVVGKAAELVDEIGGPTGRWWSSRPTTTASRWPCSIGCSPSNKAPHAPRGPVGWAVRATTTSPSPNIPSPKRQCYFEFEPEGVKITDCGSTNGTLVGERPHPSQGAGDDQGWGQDLAGAFRFRVPHGGGISRLRKSLLR